MSPLNLAGNAQGINERESEGGDGEGGDEKPRARGKKTKKCVRGNKRNLSSSQQREKKKASAHKMRK